MRNTFLATAFLAVSSVGAASASESLEAARSAVSEWARAEQALSREAAAWQAKQASLRDLIELAEADIAKLEQEIADLAAGSSAADEQRLALLDEQEDLRAQAETVRVFLVQIEPELRALEGILPAPLRRKIAPLLQRLPANPQQTSLGVAERMQAVAGILSSILEFDETVVVDTEMRQLGDGALGEVVTLYVGLGAAYYIAPASQEAGYGVFGDAGWTWMSRPELRRLVEEAIALAEGRDQDARFISLPVELANHE